MFLIKALRKPVPIDLDHEVAACTTNVQDWICRLTIKKIRPWKPPKTSHAKPNESIIIDLICTKWYHKLYIDIYFTYFESNMYETNPKKNHSAISFPPCHTWTPNLYLSWHSWWSRPLLESEANAKQVFLHCYFHPAKKNLTPSGILWGGIFLRVGGLSSRWQEQLTTTQQPQLCPTY